MGRKRWSALLLAALLLAFAQQPGAQARQLGVTKSDVKKAAVAAAALTAVQQLKPPRAADAKKPQAPQVELPGMSAAGQTPDKKAARQERENKAKAEAEAFQQVKEMAAAGDVQAQYILGCAYFTGGGGEKNDAAALRWWSEASHGGHPEADAYMGRASEEGLAQTPRFQAEANRRYRRAAGNGSEYGALWLGIQLYPSREAQDRAEAMRLFREAAHKGNRQAKEFLQRILQDGMKARQAFGRGIDWRKETAKISLPERYTQAGRNAFWGNIVAQDCAAAAQWWELAANCGEAKGEALLGTAYYTGRGVDQDYAKAAALLKAAAQKNEPLAQYTLGKAYLEGNGVKKNKSLAAKLLRAAGDAGIADAARLADELEKRR